MPILNACIKKSGNLSYAPRTCLELLTSYICGGFFYYANEVSELSGLLRVSFFLSVVIFRGFRNKLFINFSGKKLFSFHCSYLGMFRISSFYFLVITTSRYQISFRWKRDNCRVNKSVGWELVAEFLLEVVNSISGHWQSFTSFGSFSFFCDICSLRF